MNMKFCLVLLLIGGLNLVCYADVKNDVKFVNTDNMPYVIDKSLRAKREMSEQASVELLESLYDSGSFNQEISAREFFHREDFVKTIPFLRTMRDAFPWRHQGEVIPQEVIVAVGKRSLFGGYVVITEEDLRRFATIDAYNFLVPIKISIADIHVPLFVWFHVVRSILDSSMEQRIIDAGFPMLAIGTPPLKDLLSSRETLMDWFFGESFWRAYVHYFITTAFAKNEVAVDKTLNMVSFLQYSVVDKLICTKSQLLLQMQDLLHISYEKLLLEDNASLHESNRERGKKLHHVVMILWEVLFGKDTTAFPLVNAIVTELKVHFMTHTQTIKQLDNLFTYLYSKKCFIYQEPSVKEETSPTIIVSGEAITEPFREWVQRLMLQHDPDLALWNIWVRERELQENAAAASVDNSGEVDARDGRISR